MFPPQIPVVLTALFLSVWFWRRNARDASLWMYGTYAGAGLMVWQQVFLAGTFSSGLPLIVRDFLLIGVVGLVQSLAVGKRISIGVAIAIIFACFVVAYALPFQDSPSALSSNVAATDGDALVAEYSTADPAGEYLVQINDVATEMELTAWAENNGFSVQRAFFPADEAATELDDYFVLNVDDANQATETLIQESELVEYLEINEQVTVDPVVADPIRSTRGNYGINDPAATEQWMMEALAMPEYYQLLRSITPEKTAKIAILDTGVDAQHEDLTDNYFSTQKKHDTDPRGHGTHCAGIAAAVTDNGIGIGSTAGPGKFVEVTSIRVLSAGGMGSQKTIIQGILEAADTGVDVISMSLGGTSSPSRQRAYNQAVSYAARNGAIVVAAAGNSNREATGFSPANAGGVICVAAIDNLLLRAPFSNRVGGVNMPIAAPGVSIYSTLPGSKYGAYSGTSMACPFVAGIVGVMKSIQPDLTTKQAYEVLQKSGSRTSEVEQLGPIVQPAAAISLLTTAQ